jgi:ABC-type branched-subunit amino acid transport system substrate-binding protein
MTTEVRCLDLKSLQVRLKEEYKDYYKIKRQAHQLRATALENLAEALAEQGNSDKEKMLKALRSREQQRATARKIKFLRGKIRTNSTTLVTVTDTDGTKIDITE